MRQAEAAGSYNVCPFMTQGEPVVTIGLSCFRRGEWYGGRRRRLSGPSVRGRAPARTDYPCERPSSPAPSRRYRAMDDL
nr:hypothetical protein StreXyl84_14840 [Streptomyces sp. Xyl84]